jgi:hypothetical protein
VADTPYGEETGFVCAGSSYRPATVIQRLILDALAQAARAGEDHLARRALRGADPVIRWWLRRRVARRIAWASACVADASDRGHVLRLAFLGEVRQADALDLEDRGAVRAAFDAASAGLRVGMQTRLWYATLLLAATVALFAFGIRLWSPRAASSWSPVETPLGKAFGAHLTSYVTLLYRFKNTAKEDRSLLDYAAPREALLSAVEGELGSESRAEFQGLFREYQEWVLGSGVAEIEETLRGSLLRVNGALRSRKAPYFLDSIWDPGPGPILVSYYVARENTARAQGAELQLVRVQRLDTINRSLAALGYTSPTLGTAMVSLDMIEREVVTLIAPALAPDGRVRLVDRESQEIGGEWIEKLQRSAAAAFRRDFESFRTPAMAEVIALLAERDKLFRQFQSAAQHGDLELAKPTTLVSRGGVEALEGRVLGSILRRWREVNSDLDRESARMAFEELLSRYGERVDRHELQHQIDYRAGLTTIPAELRAMLGLPDTLDISPRSNAARCRAELSADLAALAESGTLAGTALTLTASPVFDRSSWNTPHAFGGAVILHAIAAELGLTTLAPLGSRGQFDRARATEIFIDVAQRAPSDIARAARAAYAKLFGIEVARVELGAWHSSRIWRR